VAEAAAGEKDGATGGGAPGAGAAAAAGAAGGGGTVRRSAAQIAARAVAVGRLAPGEHTAVFGGLTSRLAAELDTPEVAALVRPLLDRGWRPGQLADRVGSVPAGGDPVREVGAFLAGLRDTPSPAAQWAAERSRREAEAATRVALAPEPASEESRRRWAREARRQLRGRTASYDATAVRPAERARSACALCGADGTFFVTREVHLCEPCVEVLGSGRARLASSA
jgi:hypothetical protein